MQREEKSLGAAKYQELNHSSNGHVLGNGSNECETERKANSSSKKYSPVQWITLAILAFSNFSTGACVSLQPPFFPREAESKGLTATKYGLVYGAFDVAAFVGALITGKLVAHVQPKYILNSGVLLVGVTYILSGTLDLVPSGSPFFILAFVFRIMDGFGSAAIRTAGFSILASRFRESVSTNFGLLETSRSLGYVVGPTLGGSLFDLGGYGLPFYVMGSLELFDAIIIFFVLPKSEGSGKKKVDFFKFWFNPKVMVYFLVVFTALNYTGFNNANLEPHLRQFNLSGVSLGLVYALTGSTFAVAAGLWGWISDKQFEKKKLILFASCLMVVAQTLIGPLPFFKMEPILGIVIFSQIITGLGISGKLVCSFGGALEDTVSQGFPRNFNTYGLVSSAFTTAEALGEFAGPSLGGLLVDNLGYRMATVVIVTVEILLVVTVSVYICTGKSYESTTEDEEKTPIVPNNSGKPPSYC